MKNKLSLLLLLTPFSFSFLFSCNNNNDFEAGNYRLTLCASGGEFPGENEYYSFSNVSKVNKESALLKPSRKTGFTFLGYYESKYNVGNPISFPYSLKSDTVLYAHYSGDLKVITTDGGEVKKEGNKYIISSAGSYKVLGNSDYETIYVDAPSDADVTIEFKDVEMNSYTDSLLYVNNAHNVYVKADKDSKSFINDKRGSDIISSESKGAIHSNVDLNFIGNGELSVNSNLDNAIESKDDIKIKNLTLNVYGYKNGIKANDSITINSGNVNLSSLSGNALKTSNTDKTSKENNGDIIINGGSINIDTRYEGIDSSMNTIVGSSQSKNDDINLNIKCGRYSSFGGDEVVSDKLYFISNKKVVDWGEDCAFYVYSFNNDLESGEWSEPSTYVMSKLNNEGETSYYYSIKKPVGYTYLYLYVCKKGSPSRTDYVTFYTEKLEYYALFNALHIMMFDTTKTDINLVLWERYKDIDSASSKGIKSNNNIYIYSGNINIYAYDDAVHAKSLDVSVADTGVVNIEGGNLFIHSNDDGIHADSIVKIKGGNINIDTAFEAIEGMRIEISGGSIKMYALNDGLNASGKSSSIYKDIVISGDNTRIDYMVEGLDVDGLDSNNDIYISGGTIIGRCYSNGDWSSTMDCSEGTCYMSGNTIMLMIETKKSGPESKPMKEDESSITPQTFNNGLSAGKHEVFLNNTFIFDYSNSKDFKFSESSGVYVYTLRDGTFLIK